MSRRDPKERVSDRDSSASSRVDKPGDSGLRDEERAFREAMRDVKPLRHARRVRPTPGARGSSTPRKAHRPAFGARVGGTETLSFRRAGVRDQVIRKLRRGLIPIEDELDLHGLNQSAARDLLEEFIVQQREAGHRCARIIHGKGYRSGARGPILKMLVNGWLKRHLDVLAFCSARPIDGGAGAVYVLLRA